MNVQNTQKALQDTKKSTLKKKKLNSSKESLTKMIKK